MADPHTPETPQDPLVGKTLGGRYLIRKLIDRGGMGKVYKAEQQPLGRMVALKTLDLMDPRGEFQQRFFNEASIASRLTHPNTVRIFDYGRSDEGVYYLTMELLEGQSLHKLVKMAAPLDPMRVISMMRQVCGALHEAHELGIVHRDLKPGNIFLTRHGDDLEFAKVLDFGLVKDLDSDIHLSQTGQTLGSPLYMSPEQVEGETVDRRADIYSLGLVMYVSLTGKVPFKKGSVATIMMQQVTGTIPRFAEIAPDLDIPQSLEWIVRRCIEKRREDRIASMRELSVALKLCARQLKSEVPGEIAWKLDDSGHLDLPDDILGQGEETAAGGERPRAEQPLEVDDLNEIPSSPTLNRSSASVAAGAALAGGGLLMFAIAAGLGLIVVLVGVGIWMASPGQTPAPQPQPQPIVQPAPPPQPQPEPTEAASRVVTVDSTPASAEVLKGGVFIGTTPLEVTVEGDPVKLLVQSRGYEPREVLVDGTVKAMKVPLEKKSGGVAPVQPVVQPSGPKPMSEVRGSLGGVMWWVVLLAVGGAPAHASDDDARAKELFRNGRDLYDNGRYEDAIAAWTAAYDLYKKPLLLYNLSNAYERTAQFGKALDALTRYRAFAPEEEADTLDARISSLESRASDERRERDAADAERKAREAELEAQRKRAEDLAAQQGEATSGPTGKGAPILPVATGVAGVSLVTVGVASGLGALNRRKTLDDPSLCADGGICKGDADEPLRQQRNLALISDVSLVGGLAVSAVSALLFVRHAKQPEPRATVWAMPTDDGARFGVSSAF